jgi:hypothetical protein
MNMSTQMVEQVEKMAMVMAVAVVENTPARGTT